MAHTMLQCMTLEHNPCILTCGMTLSQISGQTLKPISWGEYGQHEILHNEALRYMYTINYLVPVVMTVASQLDIQRRYFDLEHGAVLIAGYKHGGSPVLQSLRLTSPLHHELKAQILLIPSASLCCRHH